MKAQISTEFLAYTAILVVIMVFAMFFAITTGNEARTEGINIDAKRIAGIVATEINTAVEVGDGYSHRFFLPQTLRSETNYTLQLMQQRVYIFWNGRSYSLPVLAGNVTGIPASGYNIVRNINGAIKFE